MCNGIFIFLFFIFFNVYCVGAINIVNCLKDLKKKFVKGGQEVVISMYQAGQLTILQKEVKVIELVYIYYIIILIIIKTWKRLMAIELNMDHKPSQAMNDL